VSLRSFVIQVVILIFPGVLLLAGGRSPPRATPPEILDLADMVAAHLYPDDWVTLPICSILICLPGVFFVTGADYLEEITFWRIPVNTTPAVMWRGIGHVFAVGAAAVALIRLIGD
jgi:hypothetical protein